jgi:UDP-N-acetylglucosamine acyltransferase
MNFIHPTSIVSNSVSLGNNNYIGPFCYITGNTIIGDNNRFESHCSIGTPAEHRDYFIFKEGKTVIGNNNIFREFTTVNAGTKDITILKNNIIMLRNSYIGHDCIIEDKVNLSCNVLIGGHSHLMEGCNFGLGAICHQFSIIGAYSMIGMGAIITKNTQITPGKIYVGSPAKYLKENLIGLERNNINDTQLKQLITKFNILNYGNELF